jgi:hypothetical protein
MSWTLNCISNRAFRLGHSLKNVNCSYSLDLSLVLWCAKHHQNLCGKFEQGFLFNCIPLCHLLSVWNEAKLLIFLDELFDYRAGTRHKLFKLQCLVFGSFALLTDMLTTGLLLADHFIIRSLLSFVLRSQIFCLNISLNSLICTARYCCFDNAAG